MAVSTRQAAVTCRIGWPPTLTPRRMTSASMWNESAARYPTLLWFLWDDSRLSVKVKTTIVDPVNRKLVSLASCWEISIKASTGKLQLGELAARFLSREIQQNHFDLLPIALHHATAVETLPFHHRDPFDRLLIAQAQADQLPLVSVDSIFDSYGVTRLW